MKGNFQLIVMVVFIATAIFGVLVFSGAIPLGGNDQPGSLGTVVLWGTVGQGVMAPLLEDFNRENPSFVLRYVQKNATTFDKELLEALATGTGPDMFFLPENLVFHYTNKIFPIPYTSYPVSAFKNNFAGAGEVFLTSGGILAFPLSIDPLMMYYNRSMLDANGIVYPPAFWHELTSMIPKLTTKDEANKIMKSAVALGHFSNVTNAKDILSALFMQSGSKIVAEEGGIFDAVLDSSLALILQFYTDFADPSKEVYSWNKSFPNSTSSFSKEDLAFYFGFASELQSLINRNPNQNFFIAPLPQMRNAISKLTSAKVTGVAILTSSQNLATAFTAASLLSGSSFASKFAVATGTVPARRDLLTVKPIDAYFPIFYDSALYARSWPDPSSVDTTNIFRNMVEGVLSNSMTPQNAIVDADTKIKLLLLK